ncbi:hypothetical protein [Cellvibrio sp.]|uniref:hypothetical protein n=1 Tax=Cellvibrio sp. TaxID=1965322 RepID=UPI00374EC16B
MTGGYRALTSILLALQLGLLVFSMLYPSSVFFFLCLKTLLIISILIWLIDREKPTKWLLYGTLLILPGIWGLIIGLSSDNPGAHYEIPVYLLAPICYLIAFRYARLSFLKSVIPVLKIVCGINLAVFFFLYFSGGGHLYTILQHATMFVIQQLDGYHKVYTLQATQLIFLLPVILIHFFFKQNTINFILVAGCTLMALLIGRKIILIIFVALMMCLCYYSLYRRRSFKHIIMLVAPVVAALAVFPQISEFDNQKYMGSVIDSVSSLKPLPDNNLNSPHDYESKSEHPELMSKILNWDYLYNSSKNRCSVENNIKLVASYNDLNATIRNNQIQILADQIALSPWLGHGLGYVVKDCIRSSQQPWRFEMTYLAMAMDIGLLGVFVYCIVYIRWMLGAIRANLDRSVSFPLLGASLFFLICAASNPYIMSVENLWIFFVPYLLVQIIEVPDFQTMV